MRLQGTIRNGPVRIRMIPRPPEQFGVILTHMVICPSEDLAITRQVEWLRLGGTADPNCTTPIIRYSTNRYRHGDLAIEPGVEGVTVITRSQWASFLRNYDLSILFPEPAIINGPYGPIDILAGPNPWMFMDRPHPAPMVGERPRRRIIGTLIDRLKLLVCRE